MAKVDAMRAAFHQWVQDQGCDTDGAWSAWQAAWNLRSKALEEGEGLPAALFDGNAVYWALSERAKARTSPENVSDVLDAVVRLMRKEKQ